MNLGAGYKHFYLDKVDTIMAPLAQESEAKLSNWLKVTESGGGFFPYSLCFAGLDVLLLEVGHMESANDGIFCFVLLVNAWK